MESGGRKQYRDGLIKIIHENVSCCKNKFGGRTLLATENEQSVLKIINGVEIILQDGLKAKSGINLKNVNLNVNHFSLRQVTELVSNGISMVMGPQTQDQPPVFWHFVRNHLTRHEQERYYHIQNVTTDYGRGRSWLRSSINEHSLDRYLRMLFSDENLLLSYYETHSLMNDTSSRECLLESAKELRSVIFALVVDRKELDQVDQSKILMMQSLRPEPEAVRTVRTSETPPEQGPTAKRNNQNKKSRVRVVDLEDSTNVHYGQVETAATPTFANTMAISIPEDGTGRPSLLMAHIGSSPSVQSLDSQDALMVADSSSVGNNKHSALNLSEMRQMLLDLTEKKNKLEETKAELQLQLHGVQLENQGLEDRLKVAEQQNTETTRENSILKEQLKHYMGVVQMLKSNGPPPNINSPTSGAHGLPPPDYHREANHFEDKLIQVAEMHGELMEFNSHLQSRLALAERSAERFRSELVHLRGPLPTDYCIRDEDSNRPRDGSASSETPLIHIWIPTTFRVQGTVDSHHVYQIFIRMGDTEWTVFKRYSQIYKFRKEMKKRFSFVEELHFPPKKSFGHRDEKTVEERRRKLQEFLRQFLNHWIRTPESSEEASNRSPIRIPLDHSDFVSLLPFFSEQRSAAPS